MNLALFLMRRTVHLHYEEKLSRVVTLNADLNPLWPINGEAVVGVSAKALKLSRSHWFGTFGNWLCMCVCLAVNSSNINLCLGWQLFEDLVWRGIVFKMKPCLQNINCRNKTLLK